MIRVAILDDYNRAARTLADWAAVDARATVTVIDRALAVPDEAAEVLAPYDVLCHLRERTAMPRALIERLPNLKLVTITGGKHRTLDMDAATDAARHLLYTACEEIEAGHEPARWAALCKLVAGDAAMRVTTDAVQVLGGYGYIDEYPVERMMRDAKITQLYEGTQQIQRLIVARSLLAGS